MFTEDDYREYFQSILKREKAMLSLVRQAVHAVSDPELLDFLGKISKQEVGHCAMSEWLLSLVPRESDEPGA